MRTLLAALFGTFIITSAHAAITVSTPAAPLGSGSVQGLAGTFWSQGGVFLGTIAANDAAIVGQTPTATFRLNNPIISYNGDSTLSSFLDTSGSVLTGNGSASISRSYSIVDGFISIATPGVRTFTLGSDDGSQLFIGGQLAVNNDNNHPLINVSDTVNFQAAGLYAIRIKYFENDGSSTLQLYWDPTGAGAIPIPEAVLFSTVTTSTSVVPLPAAGWLLIGGVAMLGGFARRRA